MDPSFANGKVREWQAKQRGFLSQTGLVRQYDREKVATGSPSNILEIFASKENSAFRRENDTFDLGAAKEEFETFLKTVPEKNRMYLETAFKGAEYRQAKMNDAVFGYSENSDRIYFDPSQIRFWEYAFTEVNTHELAHRIDYHFVHASDDEMLKNAIQRAKDILDKDPYKFIKYSFENDQQGFLSDILSAISDGKYDFSAGHATEYWAKAGNRESEVFANLFSLEAFDDQDSLDYMHRVFPELLKAYDDLEYGI
ncbi:MAG: hypothetical protein PHE09_14120 [Oscillospiraceae bacterium]|nr:hypothetical protein [Oscillospiraceae bacterium]